MSIKVDQIIADEILPRSSISGRLGTSSNPWKNIYATTFNGNATTASKLYIHSTSPSAAATYYPTWTTGSSANRDLSVNSGFRIHLLEGTTTTNGYCSLRLGTSTATGSDKNQYGALQLYDTKDKCQELRALAATGDDGASRISYLRDYGKTGYLVATTSMEASGQKDTPVYVSDKGVITVGSLYAGGTKVTLNGTSKSASEASFYAPTAAGTSGQYLKSNGNGAPAWETTTVSGAWSAGKTTGPKLTVTVNGVTSSEATIPSASDEASGIVTTSTQTFAGLKTFKSNVVKIQGTSTNALELWAYKNAGSESVYGFGVNNALWLAYNVDQGVIRSYHPLTFAKNSLGYGTADPANAITTPQAGQIYFKLIDE